MPTLILLNLSILGFALLIKESASFKSIGIFKSPHLNYCEDEFGIIRL